MRGSAEIRAAKQATARQSHERASSVAPGGGELTSNERTTLAISFLALIVAGLTLYFSEFHRTEELEAVVLEADPLGGTIKYQVAILNGGNRPALIKSAKLLVRSPENELSADNPLSEIKLKPSLPMIVEKGGIIVLTFTGPMKLVDLYQRGSPPNQFKGFAEFDGEATRKVMIDAHFESMDSTGNVYQALTGPLVVHITKTKVAISDHEGSRRSLFSK